MAPCRHVLLGPSPVQAGITSVKPRERRIDKVSSGVFLGMQSWFVGACWKDWVGW